MSEKRKLRIMTGCKTYGTITFDSEKPFDNPMMCDDPGCASCQIFKGALEESAKKWANELPEEYLIENKAMYGK